ncbi:DUF1697 domain-containing protein [Paenibacillus sp. H1-7]|uniref:DUF1697 domain-containing protein n=1 Tax=Paenibacillus sp. H1-7 TaxID=2282849 RepID=UPI001EF970A7|nr:DUF1697 domain-containing protein [Paenibacillus sp. H1-7]ULL13963.1 DUF1697 domain-containing protein [Paenibacillus sp. H1-7]
MTVYIGLLRGINVGGKNMVKMAELKRVLEGMGLAGVKTYLQSGNFLFVSDEAAELLAQRIRQEIEGTFGIAPSVMLRTAGELEQIIDACPYAADSLREGESIQVSILTESPPENITEVLSAGQDGTDEFHIHGQEIYYLFRQSVLDSKLASNVQKLGALATTRNWNTIVKLAELATAMRS